MRVGDPEIKLGEDRSCATVFDVTESVSTELLRRIQNQQVVWLEESPDVIYSDRYKSFRSHDLRKRRAAPANEKRFLRVVPAEVRELARQLGCKTLRGWRWTVDVHHPTREWAIQTNLVSQNHECVF